jgi:hypothetical protein
MRPRIKAPARMPLWPHMKAMVMCMPTPGLLRLPSGSMCVSDQEWAEKALSELLARLVRLLAEVVRL